MKVTTFTTRSREMESRGHVHVHAAGCRDIGRSAPDHPTTHEATTIADVVDDWYGPGAGSFYQESATQDPVTGEWVDATWRDYVGDFYFAPCTSALT